jgi:endonuclease/exonuclease/phosphatase family metal-dependent hydrolase
VVKHTPVHEPIVVLGDINEWLPYGRPLRWLNAIFGHSPAERTFPSRWPVFALDRVWVRPRHSLLAFGAHRSPLAVDASDHLPVKALIAAREPAEHAAAQRLSGAARLTSRGGAARTISA